MANAKFAGLRVAAGATPVPDNVTTPLAPTVRVPVTAPVAVGVKATSTVHDALAARVVRQVELGWVKLAVVRIVPTVSVAVAVFVNVTICAELVEPTNWLAKLRFEGDSPPTATAAIVKLWVTCGAGLKFALPAWLAAMMQVPLATPVTVDAAIVQIAGVVEVNVTGRPELAVAVTVPVPPTVIVGAVPNAMV